MKFTEILPLITFNDAGLVPVIAQHFETKEVLMMAWMNREVYYWSRSRKSLWKKGETSGHFQYLKTLFVDCDGDTILLHIDQVGPACHTGERTCFFKQVV